MLVGWWAEVVVAWVRLWVWVWVCEGQVLPAFVLVLSAFHESVKDLVAV